VRVVDWDDESAKLANVAANNPALAGDFTPDVAAILEDIEAATPDLFESLLLDAIDVPEQPSDGAVGKPPAADVDERMELQPFEHYDYVLVLADNTEDWEWLCDKLKLKPVNASALTGKKQIGLGRAIPARRLIELLEGKSSQ